MHVGFSLRQLVETVQLLQDFKWTSTIAEQQQGSVAALKRTQPEYHEVTLVARAQVLATTRLLPKPTEDEQVPVRRCSAANGGASLVCRRSGQSCRCTLVFGTRRESHGGLSEKHKRCT